MDEAVYNWAITAVDHQGDTSRAGAWFAAIHVSYTEPEQAGDYPEFTARLLEGGVAAGVDESVVRQFTDDLAKYSSTPLDEVQELADKHDTLADKYVELLAAAAQGEAAPADEDVEAEAAEALWNWDDSAEEWSHFEDGEWVPQRSWDGTQWLVLNQDKAEWVAQRTYDGEHWWVMSEDRSEWVLEQGQEPAAAEVVADAEAEVVAEAEAAVASVEQPEPDAEQPAEPLTGVEAVVATEVVAPMVEEAMAEFDEFDELTEEEIQEALARVLANELDAA
jgi:hypothetical protein